MVGYMHMYCIYHNTLFFYENPSTTSPAAKPNPSSPNWHRLPNWERKLISLGPYICSPAPSCSPLGAKTSQMGVMNPATPKIYNIPPQQRAQPPAHIWQCLYLFTSVPNPCSTSLPPTQPPPPSHPAPSARQSPYPLIQKILLLILTTPGSTAGPCFSSFFGWWASTTIHV